MERTQPFAVCFSGHRPEKLPTGNELRMVLSLLYSEIESAVAEGAAVFYTGCARGIDLWAAEYVLHLRKSNPELKLICVQPYAQQAVKMPEADLFHYNAVLQAADRIICLSPHFYRGCFRARNSYMIQRSQRLIALVSDMKSGTGQTIRMAKRAGLDVRMLSLEKLVQQTELTVPE